MRGASGQGTCWFDELFEGGIVLPEVDGDEPRALTILLSGPPGTGKSTLATEFCFRAARSEDIKPGGLRSHYVTVEAHRPWMIENARLFGWEGISEAFAPRGPQEQAIQVVPARSRAELMRWAAQEPAPSADLIGKLATFFGYRDPDPIHPPLTTNEIRDILVIDSLNTIQGDKAELFDRLMSLVSSGHKIIILIIDSDAHIGPQAWDFAADIVIRLDRDYSSGYLIRTLEVVKARYQPHVWGKHQLKVYEPFARAKRKKLTDAERVRYLRAHPYREEGGIFIFPSIHYVLSRYKTKSPPERPDSVPSPMEPLTWLLGGGLPRGRCVGLIGGRGTHKSHLGYMHILSRLLGSPRNFSKTAPQPKSHAPANESALIVSLRDDEGTMRRTLKTILDEHWQLPDSTVDKLEADGRLEVTYYPPGFITPEEFFHRLLLSINRLKGNSDHEQVTVLFNSLDQLSSRFPLCAEQKIFIPGIIQMLSAEETTSIFVAAHEEQANPEYYGLLSMAELILSMERESVDRRDCLPWIKSWLAPEATTETLERILPPDIQTVKLTVIRFAGGQPAGATGILELVKPGHPFFELCGHSGLMFIPCVEHNDATAATQA